MVNRTKEGGFGLLPTIRLGDCDISRLIIGGNPFSGNSHVSAQLDAEMEDYFTTDNVKATLWRCVELGMNTMQLRGDKHIFRILREFRLEGGQMHWIAQTASEMRSFEGNVNQIVSNQAAAIYHHGTTTDSLFKAGEFKQLQDRLTVLRATGKPVGLATHMPEVIEYAEEERWDIDFYMCSVYNLSKEDRVSSAITGIANKDERFDPGDPALMYKAIRNTKKPCLAFKILGASRRCESSDTVRQAFREAFNGIKSTDAVIVGVFPRDKDQVAENVQITKDVLGV